MTRWAITRAAAQDIAEIEDYTAVHWGDRQAETYVAALYAGFAAIAENPALGRRRPDIPPPFLVHAVGSHLIVYRFNPVEDRVEVLNILHPAMDVAARLAAALRRTRKTD